MFGQDFDVKVWSKVVEFWNLIKICVRTWFIGKQNSNLGSVVPLAMFLILVHDDDDNNVVDGNYDVTNIISPSQVINIVINIMIIINSYIPN